MESEAIVPKGGPITNVCQSLDPYVLGDPRARQKSLPSCQHKRFKKAGFFSRSHDQSKVQRYRCLDCGDYFSTPTNSLFYRAKKPEVAQKLYTLLNNNSTLRRSSLTLRVTRKTIRRYFVMIGNVCRQELEEDLLDRAQKITTIQFDEMETYHEEKLKPLSIFLTVEAGTRRILAFAVSEMPRHGKLAAKSKAKYGKRPDYRGEALDGMLKALTKIVIPKAHITTDKCSRYPKPVKKHFPEATHDRTKGRRGCIHGQGELKEGGFDPLFSLNHTAAMIRASTSRLFRRTWNTTKRIPMLMCHLLIYAHFHNFTLLNWPSTRY